MQNQMEKNKKIKTTSNWESRVPLASPSYRTSQPPELPTKPSSMLSLGLRGSRSASPRFVVSTSSSNLLGQSRRTSTIPSISTRTTPTTSNTRRARFLGQRLIMIAVHHSIPADSQIPHTKRAVIQVSTLEPASSLLNGAEFLQELTPANDALFAALEPVGSIKIWDGGSCWIALHAESASRLNEPRRE